jgi:hypothetical protein
MAVSLREVLHFGRYEPLFRVAAGGMAEVYAATIQGEAGFQKLVAVKRMLPHLASEPGFVDMFLNEAKLAAYVTSPHVVQTLDLGRGSDGSLYIVMELVVGLSLARLMDLRPGALPTPIAIEILAQASQGLDDAHEASTPAGDPLGLVHRDVSPHNILIGTDGRIRVTDFGIARAIHRPRAETNIRELKGKFAYMSPEQTRLKPLDRRSDIFSLGTTLWEILTGERLFAHRDPIEAVRLVQKKPIPAPHSRRTEIPTSISLLVMRALERDPGRRVQSAGELAQELRRAAREAYGEPPGRKEITAYVEDVGGEELKRLQRLIRLGTEGAAVEAIEAVQPGVTKVLSEDASGVALVGSRRTAVIDDGEEEDIGPPTLLISAEEKTPVEPHSVDLPTAIFENPSPEEDPLDRTDPIETKKKAAADEAAPTPVDPVPHFVQAPPPAPRAAQSGMPALLIGLAAIAGALVIGIVIAVVALWPDEPEPSMVVLPLEEPPLIHVQPMPPLPAPVVEAPAPAAPPIEAPAAPLVEETPPVAAEPEPEQEPAHVPSRRPRRVRAPQPIRRAEPPPRGSTPTLMGVSDFDRRSR